MPSELARNFMRALQDAEQSGNVGPLADLFREGSELRQVTGGKHASGHDGATKFWTEYLAAFKRIRSTFTRVVENPETTVLEWTSEVEGTAPGVIRYEGITVLEHESGGITDFRTYYDSARFTPRNSG